MATMTFCTAEPRHGQLVLKLEFICLYSWLGCVYTHQVHNYFFMVFTPLSAKSWLSCDP